jgi:hypothetical protein
MTDQGKFVDRFSVDVDRILEQKGRSEEDGPPPEYAEMLSVAGRLATLDFAASSQLRGPLRRRLLHRLVTANTTNRRSRLMPLGRRRALGALAVLAAMVVLVGWTPTGRAVAQAVGRFVLELRWPHTIVQQVAPGEQPQPTPEEQEWLEAQLAAGHAWTFRFGRYGFEGCCYSKPVRDEVVPVSQARDEAGFKFQLPRFVPDGYAFSELRLLGVVPYDIFVIYEGGGKQIGLYQFSVGLVSEERSGDNVAVVERRAVDVRTGGSVQEVALGSTTAALINGERLVWEADNISFHLIGPGLNSETLFKIAESLAPVH